MPPLLIVGFLQTRSVKRHRSRRYFVYDFDAIECFWYTALPRSSNAPNVEHCRLQTLNYSVFVHNNPKSINHGIQKIVELI